MSYRILSRNEILGDYVSLFKYLNPIACTTDYATASGLFTFTNDDNVIAAKYWLEDTFELNYNKAFVIDENGNIDLMTKNDKYFVGIRVCVPYTEIKNNVTDEIVLKKDLSVGDYGMYPKTIANIENKNLNDTNISFDLPIHAGGNLSKYKTINSKIYELDNEYYLNYPMQHNMYKMPNGKQYFENQNIIFKLEKIRWWIDKIDDIAISQDILIGGIPYSSKLNHNFDEYYESDINEVLNIFSNNVDKSLKLEKKLVKSR